MSRGPRAGPCGLCLRFLPPFWMFTKECGLEVDCNRVQERAWAKVGSTLSRSTWFVLYSKTFTCVLITCCEAWLCVKSNTGSPDVERCKHFKSWATTAYFSIGRLGQVSTYVQHVWGIIGHVTVEVVNIVGTEVTPPQIYVFDFLHLTFFSFTFYHKFVEIF
jgi:hypothetical protein